MKKLRARGWLQTLAVLLVVLFGCAPRRTGPLVQAGMYPGTPEGLQRLWMDILLACQKDDRERIRELMASFMMTQQELGSLIGPAQAQALWPRYKSLLGAMIKPGSIELSAHVYEKKYDDIAVNRIDTQPKDEQIESDRNIQQAMTAATAVPFYTVRVKKKTDTRGLRYDFFIYLNGFWRSGSLLGKYLPPAP